jgi:hypothetical protein
MEAFLKSMFDIFWMSIRSFLPDRVPEEIIRELISDAL